MKQKIDYLSSVPQPDQRTDEWYIFRHKHLTASSIWKVFSTECARNQLIYDKCKPIDTSKFKRFSTESPMHWGHKYEPLSIMWYEHKYSTHISDFGCIPHDSISFLAASPDGINTCAQSPRFGRMLEVKNIVNRVINGIPKFEYWVQMQLQMEVCKLNECDFLETRFTEYETEIDFENDGKFTHSVDGKEKGIILYFIKEGQPHYEYAPFMCSREQFMEWETKIMHKNESLTWMKNIYWKLQEISCVLVLRNKPWFYSTLDMLQDFWEIIEREKKTGYSHRAPNKKTKILHTPSRPSPQCIINIKSLGVTDCPEPAKTKSINEKTKKIICNTNNNSNKIISIKTQSLSSASYAHDIEDS
jgi:putative phage-type endonuclease